MKTLLIFFFALISLSFTIPSGMTVTEHSKLKTWPKTAKEAAVMFNESFAKEFKQIKFKAHSKYIKQQNIKGIQELIANHPSLTKEDRVQLYNDLEQYGDVRAWTLDVSDTNICDGDDVISVWVGELGQYPTEQVYLFSTCGYLRCLLNEVVPDKDECPRSGDPVKTLNRCQYLAGYCCIKYYCFEENCPESNCNSHEDCAGGCN